MTRDGFALDPSIKSSSTVETPARDRSRGLLLGEAEATALRGLAILIIVLHNFLHVLPQSPGENEMDFDAVRVVAALDGIRTDAAAVPRQLSAYLGHYGVQVFIFLSAFGLTRKFSRRTPAYGEFLASRVARIYPLFLLSCLLFLVRAGWQFTRHGAALPTGLWESLLLKVTLLSNLVPDEAFRPVGPWWFLPFIFQFYAVFPWLLAGHRRWGTPVLLGGSMASVAVVVVGLPVPVMTTVIGHLPEFCLGIWFAASGRTSVPGWMTMMAVPLFVLGNVSAVFWPVSHLSALVLILGLWQVGGALVMRTAAARIPLAWLGALALPLFLVNGFLRQPFLGWAQATASETRMLGFAMLFLLVSLAAAWCLSQTERLIRSAVRGRPGRRLRLALAS